MARVSVDVYKSSALATIVSAFWFNYDVCKEVYSGNPCKRTLKLIGKYNRVVYEKTTETSANRK